jgi:hemolysin activation/secretion protein
MHERTGAKLILLCLATLLAGPRAGAAPPEPVEAAPRHFDVDEYRVEGNTVLPAGAIEDAVYPFMGPDRTADDVEKARAALDALYASRGYPTVSAEVPSQDGANGIILLKITERKIGRLRVRGATWFSPREIREAAGALAEGKVPNMTAVQKQIVALNQWPDRTVTPVLRPGIAPDTVDVDLNVKDALPLHGSVEVNNRANADTTSLRTISSLSYGNLWQRGDSASLSYQIAPKRASDAQILAGSYLFRLPDTNLSVLFSYVKSDSNVSTVGNTDTIGRGTIAGVRLLVPIRQEGAFNSSLSLGFDYKHFDDATIQGGDRTPTPVTYVPLTMTWTGTWIQGDAETDLSASAVLGTRGIGTNAATFDEKRYLAAPDFAYLRANASRVQPLPGGLQAYAKVTTQFAAAPLISNEQFGAGGVDTVRGYLESETLGDYGATLQTELRSPPVGDLWSPIADSRGFVFADAGMVGLRNALIEQQDVYRIASVGLGIRFRGFDYLNIDVFGARALASGADTKPGQNRVLFRVNGAF